MSLDSTLFSVNLNKTHFLILHLLKIIELRICERSFEILSQIYTINYFLKVPIYISHSKKFVQVLGADHKKCKKNPVENFVIFSSGRVFFYPVELIMHQG